jgi:hypothetical protein
MDPIYIDGSAGSPIDDDEERRRERERLEREARAQEEREAQRGALDDLIDRGGLPAGTHDRTVGESAAIVTPGRQVGHQSGRGVVLDSTTEYRAPEMPERVREVDERLARPGGARAIESEMRRETAAARPAAAADVARATEDDEPEEAPSSPDVAAPRAARMTLPRPAAVQVDPIVTDDAPARPAPAPVRKPDALPAPTGADALDAGLPSESDIAGAGSRDDVRRVLRAIFGALGGAYSGRQLSPFRSDADRMRGERRQGLEQRMAQKRGDVERQDEAEAERAEHIQADQRFAAEEARHLRDDQRQDGVARAQTALYERRTGLADAELSEAQYEQEQRDALADPESEASEAARRAVRARLAALPPSQRRDIEAALGDIDALTGTEALGYLEHGRLPQPPQARMGAGSGAGGVPRAPRSAPGGIAAVGSEQARAHVRAGRLSAEAGEALAADLASSDRRVRQEAQRVLASLQPRRGQATATDEGEEIMPSVIATVPLQRGEGARIREGFSEAASHYGALGHMRQVAQRYGLSARIDPRAESELAADIAGMRAMYAAIQHTGVINPSESPRIDASIPNPTQLTQMTFGQLEARIQSFEQHLERAIVAGLGVRGVDDQGIEAALRMLRSGGRGGRSRAQAAREPAREAPAQLAGDRVRVRLPDGRVGRVPRDQVERAVAAGAEVLDG